MVVLEECGDEYILPEYTMNTPSTKFYITATKLPTPKHLRPAKDIVCFALHLTAKFPEIILYLPDYEYTFRSSPKLQDTHKAQLRHQTGTCRVSYVDGIRGLCQELCFCVFRGHLITVKFK